MADANSIVRERQLVIRREIDRRGIALKAVSLDSGIPYPSVVSYFPGERNKEPHTIPGSAIYALCEGKALPADLLSLLLPDGWQMVIVPEGIDHDEVSTAMRDFIDAKERAHHPESEAGREIGPGEDKTLRGKFAVVAGGRQ